LQNAFILQARINGALNATAEEKYTKLTVSYPDIIARVPQHIIASYLGLTPRRSVAFENKSILENKI
jgi:hypothetical protein